MVAVPPAPPAFEASGAGALAMPAVAPTSYAQFYCQAPDPLDGDYGDSWARSKRCHTSATV